jgi:hypothetical protein
MKSWTACFLVALVLAGGGALWLAMSAPPRSQDPVDRNARDGAGSRVAEIGQGMVPPK